MVCGAHNQLKGDRMRGLAKDSSEHQAGPWLLSERLIRCIICEERAKVTA